MVLTLKSILFGMRCSEFCAMEYWELGVVKWKILKNQCSSTWSIYRSITRYKLKSGWCKEISSLFPFQSSYHHILMFKYQLLPAPIISTACCNPSIKANYCSMWPTAFNQLKHKREKKQWSAICIHQPHCRRRPLLSQLLLTFHNLYKSSFSHRLLVLSHSTFVLGLSSTEHSLPLVPTVLTYVMSSLCTKLNLRMLRARLLQMLTGLALLLHWKMLILIVLGVRWVHWERV